MGTKKIIVSERISIFEMLKIGVGPSSSHTLGPWRAAQRWLQEIQTEINITDIQEVTAHLFGSLAKTGIGHGSDIAVLLGLQNENPETIETDLIASKIKQIDTSEKILLNGTHEISFSQQKNLLFHFKKTLAFHPNGLQFDALLKNGKTLSHQYFSIGGGFVTTEKETNVAQQEVVLPHPCDTSDQLLFECEKNNFSIFEMVLANEKTWHSEEKITHELARIWETMLTGIYEGCHRQGHLPGGLNVKRRAAEMNSHLLKKLNAPTYSNKEEWLSILQKSRIGFSENLQWISCFALAVNEVNASMGRVVTAPTNGAAGVIPAVLMHYLCSHPAAEQTDIERFLCVAGEIGTFFKKGATISAAMGGCQAEIGVSSAMAAAALTECMGGTVAQALMAAEIAMEHHLGLTCDPIGGLVQIPCIERNSMGAIKAINAANLAISSNPSDAIVSLDKVIETMWQTAQDMNEQYKETAEGGLAAQISVKHTAC